MTHTFMMRIGRDGAGEAPGAAHALPTSLSSAAAPTAPCCSIPTAVQQLVCGVTGVQAGTKAYKQLLGIAWSVLLDLLDGDQQLLPPLEADCKRGVAEVRLFAGGEQQRWKGIS